MENRVDTAILTKLYEQAGPMVAATEVAEHLGITPFQVAELRKNFGVISVWSGTEWLFPLFQFSGGTVSPLMRKVLFALRNVNPWNAIDHLLANDTAFGGASLLDLVNCEDEPSVDRILRQINGDGFS